MLRSLLSRYKFKLIFQVKSRVECFPARQNDIVFDTMLTYNEMKQPDASTHTHTHKVETVFCVKFILSDI